ncbi:Regulator of nonsense transcripts 1-like protein, partial [Kappamyces sp. JEL0680]
HHNEPLMKELAKEPQILAVYLQDYYASGKVEIGTIDRFLLVSNHVCELFKVMPMEAAGILASLAPHCKVQLPSTYITKLYSSLVTSQQTKEACLAMLEAIRSLTAVVKAREPEQREYFMKWAYLSTLDVLESVLTPEQHLLLGNVRLEKVPNEPNVYYCKFVGTRPSDFRGMTLVSARESQTGTIHLGTTVYNTGGGHRKIQLHSAADIDALQTFELSQIAPLATYNAQLEALCTFLRKGRSTTSAYNYLLDLDHDPATPHAPQKQYIQGSNLNESQKKAIVGVVDKPLSLVQGPPGTGKTHTLAALVKFLAKTKNARVLVATPTNAAADNVMDFCLKLGTLASTDDRPPRASAGRARFD